MRSRPRTCTLPASYRSTPKIGSGDLAPPRTDQPGQSHYLAAADLEGNIDEDALSGEPLDSHDHVTGLGVVPLPALHHVPSDHGPYQVFRGEAFERTGKSRQPSRITVTRWQISNTSSRRCEMNNTAAPAARRPFDHPEQPPHLIRRQGSRRLVHDDYPGFERQRFGNFDNLLVSDR